MDPKRASGWVRAAVRRGSIVKPDRCQDCGKASLLDGHHDDYSKPYDVVWVCRKCHCQRHGGHLRYGLGGKRPLRNRRWGWRDNEYVVLYDPNSSA